MVIAPDQFIMKAKQFIFHTKCFKCVFCDKNLNTGDEYGIKESSIVCKNHFYNDTNDLNGSSSNDTTPSTVKFEQYTNFDFKQHSTYYSQLFSPNATDTLPTPSSSSSSSLYFQQQQQQQQFEGINNSYYLCNMPPTPGYSPPNSSLIPSTTSLATTSTTATSLNDQSSTPPHHSNNKAQQQTSSPTTTTVMNQKGRPKKRKLTNLINNDNVNINNENNSNNEDLLQLSSKAQGKSSTVIENLEQLSPKIKKHHLSKMQRIDSNSNLIDENGNIQEDDDNSIDNSKFMPTSPGKIKSLIEREAV